MGFEIFGIKFFDFSRPFGYPEVFSTIIIVCLLAYIGFFILKIKSKK
ncbi:hypothetical protein [Helicobacter sp. 11S03491-1]|nr:hypothetical protein [Helicobacter sp. 11S03491-1]